ncbi:hypothetical protein IMPR6_290048 [Imperialibacter sp. EC-SDR9]|nr:hypothetical protein IMPERIA89_190019 [Imperialibacter sp. 89]CAD5275438.1 hypothetical protein IMPERIA75_410048 [Imperialibacter sp. 75]VVT19760.1 hypothetical protein IMPR6_290048 [Imperialibacter sp. EC-SDR9]
MIHLKAMLDEKVGFGTSIRMVGIKQISSDLFFLNNYFQEEYFFFSYLKRLIYRNFK